MRSLRLALVVAVAVSAALAGCADSPSTPSAPSGVGTPSSPPSDSASAVSVIVGGTAPAIGSSSQFTALALLKDGSSRTVTSQATWSSSNPAVATVSSSGLVSGKSAGDAVVKAAYGGAEGSLAFKVAAALTYTLGGTITDAASGAGMAATITVDDAAGARKTGVANAAGSYAVAGLASGTVVMTVTAPDYVAVTTTFPIYGDKTLNLAMARMPACPAIGFDSLGPHGTAFTSYARCGVTVTATTPNWVVSTDYGHPAPFIQFFGGSQGTAGEVIVAAGGGKFRFGSVDLYSSMTPIPYVITGIANGATVFTLQGTQGNTFGNFATIPNPNSAMAIDALVIRLSNPPLGIGSNPMGLDNILIAY